MESSTGQVLITGASGQLGSELCGLLTAANLPFTGTDVRENGNVPVRLCDLRSRDEIHTLFASQVISAIVHLAGVLPSAFASDPIAGAEINVLGSVNLLREAIRAGIQRFVFASSLSVYGSKSRMVDESSAVAPDEPYGAAKHLVELVGERLHQAGQVEFAALRIARVVGPGTMSTTSSPWRMELLDSKVSRITLPFAASARIAMVHVAEIAKVLLLLATVPKLCWTIYDAPAEIWSIKSLHEAMARRAKSLIFGKHPEGGPVCKGERFRNEFHFELEEVLSYLTLTKD
jgi:nucleoside-diphosphate-sugar epimerase